MQIPRIFLDTPYFNVTSVVTSSDCQRKTFLLKRTSQLKRHRPIVKKTLNKRS